MKSIIIFHLKITIFTVIENRSILYRHVCTNICFAFAGAETQSTKKPRPRKYSCRFCPKAFPDKTQVANHERVHTGEKPYSCQICGNSFKQKVNLKKHMIVHFNHV